MVCLIHWSEDAELGCSDVLSPLRSESAPSGRAETLRSSDVEKDATSKLSSLHSPLSTLLSQEVLVVGDSFYKDILPAQKAGCRTAWFKGEGWTDETYDETIPDMVITDLSDLLVIK